MTQNSFPPEMSAFPLGRIVAERYEVLDFLGHGGMGLVLKAKDLVLDGEIIVLKILSPQLGSDATAFARFRREVLLNRKLSHPNIVRIYDFGDAGNGTYFLSMEYVEGENLRDSLDRGQNNGLEFDDAVKYIYKIASGLAYAHSEGVIHRDIKPANILINSKSEAKITDFGIAKSMESTERLTATDEAVGSPIYMAPEQMDTSGIDHRSDIYSLGIMAFELVAGKPPFNSDHWVTLVKMHMTEPIPDIRAKKKSVPLWYQELLNRATAKDPLKRFQTASEITEFIEQHFEIGTSSNSHSGSSEQSNQKHSASGFLFFLSTLMTTMIIGIGGYFLVNAIF